MSAMCGTRRFPVEELGCYGIDRPWQIPLLLPAEYADYRFVAHCFRDLFPGEISTFRATVASPPLTVFDNGVPKLKARLIDVSREHLHLVAFGDSRDLAAALIPGKEILIEGKLSQWNDRLILANPVLLPEAWDGKVIATYPKVSKWPGRFRTFDLIQESLEELAPLAALRVHGMLSDLKRKKDPLLCGAVLPDPKALEEVLLTAHRPSSIQEGNRILEQLDLLNAIYAVGNARPQRKPPARRPVRLDGRAVEEAAASLPYFLSGEQRKVLSRILDECDAPAPMRHVLAGEVGSGKTTVFGVLCSSFVRGGHSCAILAPNQVLASQLAREISGWWPDLPVQLVLQGKPVSTTGPATLFVGTTALLHNPEIREKELALVVIDEEHKLGLAQKEQLVSDRTHLLLCSATCIPRTTALVEYAGYSVSHLHATFVDKQVRTRVLSYSQRGQAFRQLLSVIEQGGQAIVIYPQAKGSDGSRLAAEGALPLWERHLPGRVACIHGQMSDVDKERVLQQMLDGRCDLLIATTIVEIGLNLPRLRQITVVRAERFGLSSLHQIRGRVARSGGIGFCDLIASENASQKAMARLRVLMSTTDGMRIALFDLRQRGGGDLASGTRQSGAVHGFLPARPANLLVLEEQAKERRASAL